MGEIHLSDFQYIELVSQVLPQLLLALTFGHCLSMCYELSYEGLSYSRRFVNSLTLLSLICCTLMIAISSHLALGLGVLSSMAMIRFRVNMRDLWEMSFVFAALVVGLCCGVDLIGVGLLFTMTFCLIAMLLSRGQVGGRFRYDGVLRFWLPYQKQPHSESQEQLNGGTQLDVSSILNRYCSSYQLISIREGAQGSGAEMTFHLTLKGRQRSEHKQASRAALFNALRDELGVEDLNLMSQDHHLEL